MVKSRRAGMLGARGRFGLAHLLCLIRCPPGKLGRLTGALGGSAPPPVVAIGSHPSNRATPSAYAGEYRGNFICRSAPVSTAQPLRPSLFRLTSALRLR